MRRFERRFKLQERVAPSALERLQFVVSLPESACLREETHFLMPTLLVTGGAGYIGSHCVKQLLAQRDGWSVVTLDNLSTGFRRFIRASLSKGRRPIARWSSKPCADTTSKPSCISPPSPT